MIAIYIATLALDGSRLTGSLRSPLVTSRPKQQALARSSADGFNKGAEAAVAALLQIRAARWLGQR